MTLCHNVHMQQQTQNRMSRSLYSSPQINKDDSHNIPLAWGLEWSRVLTADTRGRTCHAPKLCTEFRCDKEVRFIHHPFAGQFGVGFYSSFMVADTVKVYTRSHLKGSKGYLWQSDGYVPERAGF